MNNQNSWHWRDIAPQRFRDIAPQRFRDRTYIMGILNVTPDSFSDGGQFNSESAAIAQAKSLVAGGADIIDIGGQSTRPGAEIIPLDEELNRVVPIVKALRLGDDKNAPIPDRILISVDTFRADVAAAGIKAGANIINDITGGMGDPEMLPLVAKLGVTVILMHIRGTPQTMQQLTDYDDLIGEIYQFFQARIEEAIACGIHREKIIIDPGIGFAKTFAQNLEIIRRLSEFKSLGLPILIGASRKSFIGKILDQPDPKQRVWGTAAACCAAIANGANIVRVHDLPEMRDICRVADAIWK
jgi:dihydropteroate synthase